MTKNKISILGFNKNANSEIGKEDLRKPPIIRKEVRNAVAQKDGRALTIKDYKALIIFLDGTEIKEDNFIKLIPNIYKQFNIKKVIKTEKGRAVVETYLYFPIEMIQEHQIKVRYRQKMREIVYNVILEGNEEEIEENAKKIWKVWN